ncbi:MAG: hypothetical protein E7342_05480 [Clostridiales bacterium]|nr:hypothetical protein [Clostridiales bacterium]
MSFKKSFDYLNVFKYLCLFVLFILFNGLTKMAEPFSLALLFTSLSLGFSLISTPILFLLSFLPLAEFELIPLMAI